jgi:ubiquinol-cytochrome c reductase iron-sulfur subunit/cytochrome b6-f complex iron-sulfur subunit
MVDENRRETLKIFIGATAALGIGALTTPLVGSLINVKEMKAKAAHGSIEVVLCESVDNCPEEYSVPIDELRKGPKFVLLKKGTMAIPAVFGLVNVGGKEYPVAYNTVCTHFGCPVNPSGGKYLIGFSCPCHGTQFIICTNPNGCDGHAFLEAYVSAGPAPQSLRPIKVAVKGDRVYALRAVI